MPENIVKGTREGGRRPAVSAALHNAWCLFVHEDVDRAPVNTIFYLSRYLWLDGGRYTVNAVVDDDGTISVNGGLVLSFSGGYGSDTTPVTPASASFTVEAGYHRIDVMYQNIPAETPSYVAWEFIKEGNTLPEYVSTPDEDWVASPDAPPDIGPKPESPTDPRSRMAVFLPQPDWSDGVAERLEWNTVVLVSESGAEQRRSVRRNPRRTFEASFNEWDLRRRTLDLTVAGIGTSQVVLPIWHDKTVLEATAAQGTASLIGDFRLKDFANDTMAVIRDPNDDFIYELVEYSLLTDTEMTLKETLFSDWPIGSLIFPIRAASILETPSISQVTADVAKWSIRFTQMEPEVREGDLDMLPVHPRTGYPVLALAPNWRDEIAWGIERKTYTLDNTVGLMQITDVGGQAQSTQRWSLMVRGREEMEKYRRMLWALRGKQQTVHVPTLNNDLSLTRDVVATDNALVVERVGYARYIGAQQDIRRGIMVCLTDGTYLFNTVVSSRISGNEEWLYLEDRMDDTPRSKIRMICFMGVGRLDTDTFEFQRHTDSDGVSSFSLMLRSLDDRRLVKLL